MAGTAGAEPIGAEMSNAGTGGAGTCRCWEGLAGMAVEENGHQVGVEPRKQVLILKTLAQIFIHPNGGQATLHGQTAVLLGSGGKVGINFTHVHKQ